jgi:hypothetical protein
MEEVMREASWRNQAYQCGSYAHGHNPHWIQAKLGWTDPDRAPLPGRLLDIFEDGTFIVEDDVGQVIRLWNHDPERLARLAAVNENEIQIQLGLYMIKTKSHDGNYVFCVSPEEERTLCGPSYNPKRPDDEQPFGYRSDLAQFTCDEQREHFHWIDKILLEEFFETHPDGRCDYD